ncbi:hypothetical protein B7486_03685 [cyanobacterium TDX16]|nr:hypothetical protein B7486_03685 [cyanobacterium TDX16]
MATIGHTLVGLTLAAGPKSRPPGRFLGLMWIGLMVLFAHLIDISEWMLLLLAPGKFSTHSVTNQPWLITTVTLCAFVLLALVRVKNPILYLVTGISILSHVVLDLRSIRLSLANLYGWNGDQGFPTFQEMFISEVWLFGLALSLVMLLRSLREPRIKQPTKYLGAALAAIATVAALSRLPFLWIPAYSLAVLHRLLVMKWKPRPAHAWVLVPLAPLLALVITEVYAGQLQSRGQELTQAKEYQAALKPLQAALRIATRSSKVGTRVYLSTCKYMLNDLPDAEHQLLQVIDDPENPYWPRLMLAYFYVAPKTRNTPFHRPEETRRLLESIAADPRAGRTSEIAREQLKKMIYEHLIPPAAPK